MDTTVFADDLARAGSFHTLQGTRNQLAAWDLSLDNLLHDSKMAIDSGNSKVFITTRKPDLIDELGNSGCYYTLQL